MKKKSQIVQVLLNLVLGPLGLFYSSWVAGLVMTVIGAFFASIVPILGWFFVYPVVLLAGFFTVGRHNGTVRVDERRHRELLDATREGAPHR